MSQLIDFTSSGLYCPVADVYIDPWKPVDRAIITHSHADHARIGNRSYLTHRDTVPMLKHTLGEYISVQAVEYGEVISINGVNISLHPAGHIIGSAQVRLEYKGEVWVVTGDFKMENDGMSQPFEPVKCDVLVMESTFGLPLFQWKQQQDVFDEINQWWLGNIAAGKTSILIGYSLGKAQRLIYHLNKEQGPIFVHSSIEVVNQVLRRNGFDIPIVQKLDVASPGTDYSHSLILAPPTLLSTPFVNHLEPFSAAMVSGWMSLRESRRNNLIDRGFVLSDHADWNQLKTAVTESGAQRIFITNAGYSSSFYRWLRDSGYDITEVPTKYVGEMNEIAETLNM